MRAMSLGVVLVPLLLQLHAPPSRAAPPAANPKTSAPAQKPKSSLQEVSRLLSSSEADEVRTGLERAALLPPKQVVPLIEARVRDGLPPPLLDVAIDSLLLLADPAAGPLLDDLARHRRAAVRTRALDAVAQLRVNGAEALLARGLDDLAPEVRSTAVAGLAEIGARGSFAQVLRANELGVEGSAQTLGKLADANQLGRLLDMFGERPLEVLAPMVAALFSRRDLADADKLRVVATLSEIATDPARALLDEQLAKLPPTTTPKLRQAITEAAHGAPQGAR